MQDLKDLAALDDFLVEVAPAPVQREAGDDDVVLHELDVGGQLVAGEGADPVQEELGAGCEVPNGHHVQPLVSLESVQPVPVSTLLKHLMSLDNVGLDDGCCGQ